MEDLFRRYFWMVGVLVVTLCAVFAAYGANHYIEAAYLPEREEAVEIPRVAPAKPVVARSKKGDPIAKRNMFCSDCIAEVAVESTGEVVDSNVPPTTTLPLRLVATNVTRPRKFSFANIQNTKTGRQGAFWLGSQVPGAGEIVRIDGRHVDFKNLAAGRVERISLVRTASSAKPAAPKKAKKRRRTPRSERQAKRDKLLAEIDEGVKSTGDNSWDIDRSVVNKVLANPAAVGRGARIVPSVKNSRPNGFKLYAIRPKSVYSKIGLMNGDTIHSINGFDLTTPDKALEVYTKVRESTNLTVNVTRRGKQVTLKYSIK